MARSSLGTPDSSALTELLNAVRAPIEFLLRTPSSAARTRIPAAQLRARCQTVAETIPDSNQRDLLTQLAESLAGCEGDSFEERLAAARRCHELLGRLTEPVASATPVRSVPARHEHEATIELEPEASDLLAESPTPRRSAPRKEANRPAYRASPATTDALQEQQESLRQSVQFVPGVGPRRAELLRRFRVTTIEDLLYHLPFRYEDRRAVTTVRQLRVGESGTVRGELIHFAERYVGRSQRRILEGVLKDDTGMVALTWYNQVSFFRSRFTLRDHYFAYGKVEAAPGGQKRIVHPEMQPAGEVEGQGVLPVYEKPTTLTVGVMRKIVAGAVAAWGEKLPSALPPAIAQKAQLLDLRQAMESVHLPSTDSDVEALNGFRSDGHRSIVFDELFYLQLGMLLRRRTIAAEQGLALTPSHELGKRLSATLPFQLTPAQRRVLAEIFRDMAAPRPMHRLVQGDVGSGKTIVALFAAAAAIENGYQAAFMAPTELLAEQHATTLTRFGEAVGLKVAMLTGALGQKQKRIERERIAAGEVQLVVGTHALIQDGVRFQRLGLGVIDEQHRFGVMQRAALRKLGQAEDAGPDGAMPDILLMTATPIPRSLAMTVYGDLDVSIIDSLPAGRKPIRTSVFSEADRQKVYSAVCKELDAGHQAYIVYPLVEGSEDVDLRDATTMAKELARSVFTRYRVGLVHGKMKPAEKEAAMRRFKAGDLQVLVSTTVVEVGIDVPNATVMVVEHADRFGLAQLHQLRGRVGRGGNESYCWLIAPPYQGDVAFRRLRALAQTNDGFKIADLDLELRGPGELLGTRQSGLPDFRAANLVRDRSVLVEARQAAEEWLAFDPTLGKPESAILRRVLAQRWAGRLELAEIG